MFDTQSIESNSTLHQHNLWDFSLFSAWIERLRINWKVFGRLWDVHVACPRILIDHMYHIWRSTSNTKCHVIFSKKQKTVNWPLHFLFKCHLNITCLVEHINSNLTCQLMSNFFFTSQHYLSKSKLCMSIDLQFFLVQVFHVKIQKLANFLSKLHIGRHACLPKSKG